MFNSLQNLVFRADEMQSVFHIITLIVLTRMSEYFKEKSLVSMLQAVWTLPCLIALRVLPAVINDRWGTYAIVTVLLSYPYCRKYCSLWCLVERVLTDPADAILVAWTSKNSNNVGTRSVSAALYNVSFV